MWLNCTHTHRALINLGLLLTVCIFFTVLSQKCISSKLRLYLWNELCQCYNSHGKISARASPHPQLQACDPSLMVWSHTLVAFPHLGSTA